MDTNETRTDQAWRDLLEFQSRENSGLFFKLAYGVLRNQAEAEDACQHALLSAWKSRQQITNPKSLRAWLCRSVINASLAQLRRQRTDERAVRKHSQTIDLQSVPDETAESHELAMAALAEVAEPARTVVVLRVMEGLSGQEVAKITGCSPAEVSRRLHRGLEDMRRYLSRRHLFVAKSQ